MIRHIIFWTFSDKVSEENAGDVLARLRQSVSNMVGKIDGLLAADIGRNLADGGCDFVYCADFQNKQALAAYQQHPLHLAHKRLCAPYVSARQTADYET